MVEQNRNRAVRALVNSGTELAGGAVAGALGFLAAGPAGAAAFGAAGITASRLLEHVGQEVSDRLLSAREKQRVGGVIAVAAADIRQRLEAGEHLRADGFFNCEALGRSAADEVAESIVLKVQREPEEKKLSYMGHLLSSVAFDDAIGPEMAHQIAKSAERLTYRQLCLLKIFGVDEVRSMLRDEDYRKQTSIPIQQRQILYESFDLARNYYIASENYILGVTDIRPRQTQTQGIGADMYNLMKLRLIPTNDLRPIIEQLT